MPRKLLKTSWGGSKYIRFEILVVQNGLVKASWIGKLNLEKKIQDWMFKDSIQILYGLIAFIKGLIARKIDFQV
jgi:hypothetical protein